MRKIYLLFFVLTTTIVYCQETSDFELIDKTFQYQFNKATNEFTICQISKTERNCTIYHLKNEDAFALPEMQSHITAYYKDLKETLRSYDSLEIEFSTTTLLNKKKDTVYIKQPIKVKAFLIELTKANNDTIYSLKPLNSIFKPLDSIKIKYSEIVSKDAEFKLKLKQTLIDSLNNKKDDILKIVTQTYTDEFNSFYKRKIAKSEDYTYLATEEFTLSNDSTEKIIWLHLIKKNIFYLKAISEKDEKSFKIYGPLKTDIGESEFVQRIFEQYNQFAKVNSNDLTLEKIFALIKSPLENNSKKESKKFQKEMVAAVADSIENIETTYSGRIILKKEFKLYPTGNENKIEKTFKVDSATISFFNNRADNIAIVGRLDGKSYVLLNNLYSLPLREFNNPSQTNGFPNKYKYHYNDVFDYVPDLKYNYAVKSEEIQLLPEKPVKIRERKLMDYFTGIFFSDFLGLNNNNTNGLIVAEAQMRFPLHLRNYKFFTLLDNITIHASANLFSGFANSNRKIELADINSTSPESFVENDPFRFKTDNFNLLLNNNIDAGIRASIATLEWKGASTFVHLRYGLRFLRTGVEYNLNESLTTEDGSTINTLFEKRDFQIFSVGQELETNFEIRPQSNIGADLTIGLNWFGATGTNKNDIKFNTTNNSPNIKVMANLYALTNPNNRKSGLFFRLGGHYDLGNYDLYPQIMVGYATNLTSFVNRVQSK
ncbi:hypothetical protein [Maribacter hydrothermalis]|uniref:Uncharacterized protein n=1 Tax=Maribacter hydrothermalis TaxID=1836467 RepID=A0A1B7ZD18_9FLAO|nr:hypothetical protein [Maribacter hydrothermalis]APQ18783.1 hypothetical protein BTR34_16315 [Maribacter hydrothermalis]OBR41027.1 hypothetical protein A9200_14490 [Maribacter hydrothermalis]